jgi:hypothetical protein
MGNISFFDLIDEALKGIKVKNPVEPKFGSIIYTDLLYGLGNHSGIYVGDRKVVAISGDGSIRKVGLTKFTGGTSTVQGNIYVPHDILGKPFGSRETGYRALDMIGERRSYSLLLDNCHQFCSGCVTGIFENHDNFLWMLKDTAKSFYDMKIWWRRWNRENWRGVSRS